MGLKTLKMVTYSMEGMGQTNENKIEMSKFQKVFVVAMVLVFLVLGILFIFSSAIDAFSSKSTFAKTFGQREIVLSTVKQCKLNFNTFPIIVFAIYVVIVLLLIIRTGLLAFTIRICKKQILKLQQNAVIHPVGHSETSFIVSITVITCSFAILAVVPEHDFIITAVMAIILGLNAIFTIHFTIEKANDEKKFQDFFPL